MGAEKAPHLALSHRKLSSPSESFSVMSDNRSRADGRLSDLSAYRPTVQGEWTQVEGAQMGHAGVQLQGGSALQSRWLVSAA